MFLDYVCSEEFIRFIRMYSFPVNKNVPIIPMRPLIDAEFPAGVALHEVFFKILDNSRIRLVKIL